MWTDCTSCRLGYLPWSHAVKGKESREKYDEVENKYCPYKIGSKISLRLQSTQVAESSNGSESCGHEGNESNDSDTNDTGSNLTAPTNHNVSEITGIITKLFKPFTLSCVMVIELLDPLPESFGSSNKLDLKDLGHLSIQEHPMDHENSNSDKLQSKPNDADEKNEPKQPTTVTKQSYVLKLYDRRFAMGIRQTDRLPPWSPGLECQYQKYVADGDMAEFAARLDANNGTPYDEEEWTRVKDEAHLAYFMQELYENEVETYSRLSDVQGTCVPRFYSQVTLPWEDSSCLTSSSLIHSVSSSNSANAKNNSPGSPSPLSLSQHDKESSSSSSSSSPESNPNSITGSTDMEPNWLDTPGILLEYIQGFSIEELSSSAPKETWQGICDDAIKIVHVVGDRDICNHDIKMRNFVVQDLSIIQDPCLVQDPSTNQTSADSLQANDFNDSNDHLQNSHPNAGHTTPSNHTNPQPVHTTNADPSNHKTTFPRFQVYMLDFACCSFRHPTGDSSTSWRMRKATEDEEGVLGKAMTKQLHDTPSAAGWFVYTRSEKYTKLDEKFGRDESDPDGSGESDESDESEEPLECSNDSKSEN